MKFIAVTECPQGQQPGEIFDATEDAGHVLVMVGAAKVYKDAAPEQEQELETVPEAHVSRRGRYRRSDLRAED